MFLPHRSSVGLVTLPDPFPRVPPGRLRQGLRLGCLGPLDDNSNEVSEVLREVVIPVITDEAMANIFDSLYSIIYIYIYCIYNYLP